MPDQSSLQKYQETLIRLLISGLSHQEIIERLQADADLGEYDDYLKELDPDMIAVACELISQWAQKAE